MTSFLNWIKSILGIAPAIISDIQPVVADGEAIAAALAKVINDLKSSNFTTVIADSQAVAAAVATFSAEIQTVISQIQANGGTATK